MKHFIITVDTEADWFDMDKNSIKSIEGIHFLQEIAEKYDMKPTYLITYEIATRNRSIKILKKYLGENKCEIGHHLHAWSTPPLEKPNKFGVDENWLFGLQLELDRDTFNQKMLTLHNTIKKNFCITPRCHRAGGWGIDWKTLEWLEEHEYKVDTSVRPLQVNKLKGKLGTYEQNMIMSPNLPYVPNRKSIFKPAQGEQENFGILEVPVTTINGDFLSKLNIKGMSLIRNIIYPFGYTGTGTISFRPSDIRIPLETYKKIAVNLFEKELPVVNFMLHSNELFLGTSPYSKTKSLLNKLKSKIEFTLKTARKFNYQSIPLSKIKNIYNENKPN